MKQKMRWVVSCALILLTGVTAWAYDSLSPFESKQEWMDLKAAEKKWGNEEFSAQKFKTASLDERAKMAVGLIKSKTFLGKSPEAVKAELGPYTGYFFSDRIPAYLLNEGWKKNENTWSLVFLSTVTGKIKDVRIHKNCCSNEIWKERGLTPPAN